MDAKTFLRDLHDEVAHHPGVGHSLLGRMETDPKTRADFKIFSAQHYPLVGTFTRYLELLLLNAPGSEAKVWLAKVLVDEYGERSAGADHAAHYRIFMRACGWQDADIEGNRLHPAVTGFIADHLRWCTDEPFLVGLGAVGPGHEWAIPTMFANIIRGLTQAGFTKAETEYFDLHVEQDVDHAAWLEEALERFATTSEAQEQIRSGCLRSLAARERLWWGIADKINAGRMRQRFAAFPALASASTTSSTAGSEQQELTLAEFRRGIRFTMSVPATMRV